MLELLHEGKSKGGGGLVVCDVLFLFKISEIGKVCEMHA
jgi:hypothetical protein